MSVVEMSHALAGVALARRLRPWLYEAVGAVGVEVVGWTSL